jgi:hypothetical protein
MEDEVLLTADAVAQVGMMASSAPGVEESLGRDHAQKTLMTGRKRLAGHKKALKRKVAKSKGRLKGHNKPQQVRKRLRDIKEAETAIEQATKMDEQMKHIQVQRAMDGTATIQLSNGLADVLEDRNRRDAVAGHVSGASLHASHSNAAADMAAHLKSKADLLRWKPTNLTPNAKASFELLLKSVGGTASHETLVALNKMCTEHPNIMATAVQQMMSRPTSKREAVALITQLQAQCEEINRKNVANAGNLARLVVQAASNPTITAPSASKSLIHQVRHQHGGHKRVTHSLASPRRRAPVKIRGRGPSVVEQLKAHITETVRSTTQAAIAKALGTSSTPALQGIVDGKAGSALPPIVPRSKHPQRPLASAGTITPREIGAAKQKVRDGASTGVYGASAEADKPLGGLFTDLIAATPKPRARAKPLRSKGGGHARNQSDSAAAVRAARRRAARR